MICKAWEGAPITFQITQNGEEWRRIDKRYGKMFGHRMMGWFTLPKNTKRKSHWFFTSPEVNLFWPDHYIWFFQSVATNIEKGLKFCASSYVVCNQIWLNYSQICNLARDDCHVICISQSPHWLHKINS
jgi:hypothetical protein